MCSVLLSAVVATRGECLLERSAENGGRKRAAASQSVSVLAWPVKPSWRRGTSPDHATHECPLSAGAAPALQRLTWSLHHPLAISQRLLVAFSSPADASASREHVALAAHANVLFCTQGTPGAARSTPDRGWKTYHAAQAAARWLPRRSACLFDRQNNGTLSCIKTQFFLGTRMTCVQRLTPEAPPQEAT